MNIIVLVLVCAIILSLTTTSISADGIPSTYTGGTVDSSLRAFSSFNLTKVSVASTTTSYFHIHLFDRLTNAEFIQVPIMAAPLCMATNITGGIPVEFTVQKLGAWMMGSTFNESIESPRATTTIGTADVTLVLAANSPSTRVVIRALSDRGVTGFDSTWSLPAAVVANTNITFVADDAAVVATIKNTPNTIGFVPVAFGASLPCASFRNIDPYSKESVVTFARLDDSSVVDLDVDVETNNVTAVNSIYPLVGPVLMSLPKNLNCFPDQANSAMSFIARLFAESSFFAPLVPWGMAPLTTVDRLTVLHNLLLQLPCASTQRIVTGGSSAVEVVMSRWVLQYLLDNNIFMDYTPLGSGSGLTGIKQKTHRIAGSDALFSDQERIDYPNVRFAPLVGFPVSLIFNVPGLNTLILPRCSLVGIYNGTIKKWNDPALAAVNVATALPDAAINVVVRGTKSGTTEVFMTNLRLLDLQCNNGVSTIDVSAVWNLYSTISTSSTSSMLAALRATPYSIGYVSAASARSLNIAEAQIRDQATLALAQPSTELVSLALSGATIDPVTAAVDFGTALDSPFAWVFTGVTYFLFEDKQGAENRTELKMALDFARWAQNDVKARQMAVDADFVPVTESMLTFANKLINQASAGGEPFYPVPEVKDWTPVILGASIPSALLLIVGIGLFQYWWARKDLRSTEHAVKKHGSNFAIVFTDIEQSSLIWSSNASVAGPALDLHNEIMNDLLEKNRGYCVKTIGDSFMCVFKQSTDAINFSVQAQLALHYARWPSNELDEIYHDWAANSERSPYSQSPEFLKSRLDPTLYRGLVVRIGCHWGTASIREEQNGLYDYISPSINIASRVESCAHGGQVTCSGAFIKALRTELNGHISNEVFELIDLGKQSLKGINEQIDIYQCLPHALNRRRFPPLRVDRENDAVQDAIGGEDVADINAGNIAGDLATERTATSAATNMSDSAKERLAIAERVFARALCHRTGDVDDASATILEFYDQMKLLMSIQTSHKKRTALIQEYVKGWRIDNMNSRTHQQAKVALGNDNYWLMRVAAKIYNLHQSSKPKNRSASRDRLPKHREGGGGGEGGRIGSSASGSFSLEDGHSNSMSRPLSRPGSRNSLHAIVDSNNNNNGQASGLYGIGGGGGGGHSASGAAYIQDVDNNSGHGSPHQTTMNPNQHHNNNHHNLVQSPTKLTKGNANNNSFNKGVGAMNSLGSAGSGGSSHELYSVSSNVGQPQQQQQQQQKNGGNSGVYHPHAVDMPH